MIRKYIIWAKIKSFFVFPCLCGYLSLAYSTSYEVPEQIDFLLDGGYVLYYNGTLIRLSAFADKTMLLL